MKTKAMVRKQVYLTAAQDERLRRAARRLRRPEAEILREALDRHFASDRGAAATRAKDTIWKLVGAGASKSGDLSTRVDEILYGSEDE